MSDIQTSPSDTATTEHTESAMAATARRLANSAAETGQDAAEHYAVAPARDLFSLARAYAKDNPDVAACWAFGLGVLVGWKLKP